MMTRHRTQYGLGVACLVAFLMPVDLLSAQPAPTPEPADAPARIPESRIQALEAELAKNDPRISSVRRRIACKSFVRKAEELLQAFPAAPNRYRVLGAMLKSQKILLTLESSDRNRATLFDICVRLARAPDEHAALRLEADLLLSERDLAAADATLARRAKALAAIVERYRGTTAEAKSLMVAAQIAPKLDAPDLEKAILDAMAERFAGDPAVIEWRRRNLGISRLDVLFSGAFRRVDGASLRFPADAMGHTCLMYFWSKQTPDIETHLAAVKDLQSRYPGQLDVYSFNLDQLPDAGQKTLRSLGLNWVAVHLSGGRQSQTYRTYATRDPLGLRVNAHGHALLSPTFISELAKTQNGQVDRIRTYRETPLEQNLDDARYLAQLQSLLIGDFLVVDAKAEPSSAAESLGAIQACFTPVPMRYRKTCEEALADYTRAEKLCRDAISRHPEASDLWTVRNRRIIALLGMWNLGVEPRHLEDAVEEARTVLAAKLPPGADVAARFCLAKKALRRGADPRSVLPAFIEAAGERDVPPSACAAAAILAMDAGARDLHSRYREMLLDRHGDTPALWPVVSFLRDQNHTIRLFKANYYLPPSQGRRAMRAALRRNAAALDAAKEANRPLRAGFKTLTGEPVRMPQAADGKLTLLMFVEPPADPDANWPVAINGSVTVDSRGRRRETLGVMQKAFQLSDLHVHKGIKVIAAFLSDDSARVEALMAKYKWPCQAVTVPGGLANPVVRRLGILWADRVPNVVLLRGDGTIAWTVSGLVHPQIRSEGDGELVHGITLGMRANISQCEMEASLEALERGRFQEAVRRFSGPFAPSKRGDPDGWTAVRLHGRALAQMGLKNWEAALADIDKAVYAHQIVFHYAKPSACQYVVEMRFVRAEILDQLGREKEAQAARDIDVSPASLHRTTAYGLCHDRLRKYRLAQQ